jgi:hypothetical protein
MLEFKLKTLDFRAFVQGPLTSIPVATPHTTSLPLINQLNGPLYSYSYMQPLPPYSLLWQYLGFTQPLEFGHLLPQRNSILEQPQLLHTRPQELSSKAIRSSLPRRSSPVNSDGDLAT